MIQYNKILVIGGPGVGKTTLSNKLSKIYNIPVLYIDAIHNLPNWEIRDKEERDKIILDTIKNDKWIIDGTYPSTLEKRIKEADIIFWLDYSTITQIKGILKRYFKNPGGDRAEIPGCKERLNKDFFLQTLRYRKQKRPKVAEIVSKINQNKVLKFIKQSELNKYIKNIEDGVR